MLRQRGKELSQIRIKDIAQATNLSTATVSRALRGFSNVDGSTTEKVLKTARELGYSGNDSALAFRTQKTRNVGMVVPSTSNPFFLMLVEHVESCLAQIGYNLFLTDSRNNPDIEAEKLHKFVQSNVAGILISPTRSNSNIELIRHLSESRNLVQLDRFVDAPGLPWAGLDDQHAMETLVKHAISRKAKTVAFVTATKNSSSAKLRLKYMISEAKKYGLTFSKKNIFDGEFTIEWGKEAAQLIYNSRDIPNIIICSDDMIALGLISHLIKLGIKIPGDVLVTGLDDIPFSSVFSPTLTTIKQPTDEIAKIAVKILLEDKPCPENKAKKNIQGTLIERESTNNGS
jgi:LacI family transcriptional regulator